MRQRRIKNLEEKTAALSAYLVEEPALVKGRWAELFAQRARQRQLAATPPPKKQELYLEIGCGKGRFLTALAKQNPDKLYIGVEGAESVVLRALEKAAEQELGNVLFISGYVSDLTQLFGEGELWGIYLNFSDPWPKDRHAKRRLTHRSYLASYKKALLEGGFIELKTDNDGLFAFSLQEFAACGMTVAEKTDDLHRSQYPSKEIETEYEHKFRLLGNKIHYCKVRI